MTDAELCLALARLMGKAGANIGEVAGGGFHKTEWTDPIVWHINAKNVWVQFDPINSGADFDAVLMWARKDKRADWSALCEELTVWRYGPDSVFRRAVCTGIMEGVG